MKKTYQLYAPWITALLIALTPFLLSSDIFHNKITTPAIFYIIYHLWNRWMRKFQKHLRFTFSGK